MDTTGFFGFLYLLDWNGGYQVVRLGPEVPLGDRVEVRAADMDGDGLTDIVLLSEDEEGEEAVWLLSPEPGTLCFKPPCFVRPSAGVLALDVGDFDREGGLDLVVALDEGEEAEIIFSPFEECERPASCHTALEPFGVVNARFVTMGHFVRPLREDLLVVGSDRFAILELTPVGFRELLSLPLSGKPGDSAVGDVNGDGIDDVAVAYPQAGAVELFLLEPEARVLRREVVEVFGEPEGVFVGDLDGALGADLAVALGSGSALEVFLTDEAGAPGEGRRYPAESAPSLVRAGDIDGDGTRDLVALDGAAARVVVLPGLGRGEFAGPLASVVLRGGVDVAVENIDASPGDEIVVASPESDGLTLVSLEKGSVSLRPRFERLPVGSRPTAVEVRDVDRDGEVELVVARGGERSVTVHELSGGILGPGRRVAGGFCPVVAGDLALAVGDVDRNGWDDFVTMDRASGQLEAIVSDGCGRDAEFRRGDVDGNGEINLSDAVAILNHLFRGVATLRCPDSADIDDTGRLLGNDAVLLLSYLFRGGVAPSAPGPRRCGPDPTPDGLGPCRGGCFE